MNESNKKIIRKQKYLLVVYILLLMVFSGYSALAQNWITINDTAITRTEYAWIPVIGTLNVKPGDNVKIELIYDSRIIDIQSAEGGPNMAIRDLSPSVSTDFSKLDSARLILNSANVSPVSNGLLFMLKVKGLVYSDSIAYIMTYKLTIDGKDKQFTNGTASITVRGTMIYPNFPDNFGNAIPNPFNSSTKIKFSLEKPSKVKFYLYALNGILVAESLGYADVFKIYDNKTNQQIDAGTQLKGGSYYLVLTPPQFDAASGYYMLIMKTDRDIYNKNLIYNK